MHHRFSPLVHSPIAPESSVLRGEQWRITVLHDGLLRLEWSEDGGFEDRASTFAVRRDLPTPDFDVEDTPDELRIRTARFDLRWDRQQFSTAGLSVEVLGRISDHHSTWRWGTTPETLGGTARTLDGADGPVPLEPGVASRDGIAIVDDSDSMLFTEEGWIGTRAPGRVDVYVFVYGHEYAEAVRRLFDISGLPTVLPKWALGNWWSRYHAYSGAEYLELLDRFADDGIHFSVAVLDMDWHRVGTVPGKYGTGWTGYSWEPSLFPEPQEFLETLHERGLHTSLNLHPHQGIRPFEDSYSRMAEAMGVDPSTEIPISFDITDERFAAAYFDAVHHPLEEQGVDLWWIDWQQGKLSNLPGVDPLWVLNHVHFVDSARDGRWPLTFSRYAGPGSQRYPIGFSGDTHVTWDALRFQPEFTATASNIGYGWWSHDVGGHISGVRDDHLLARWVQLGVFSPINRLHSSDNPFLQKEPWEYPQPVRKIIGDALRFRNRLVPYLHSMNHRAAHGTPLTQPMYWEHPDQDLAYSHRNQYYFGDSLLVVPITDPADGTTLTGAVPAWIPEGTWADLFTGAIYTAGPTGQNITLHRTIESIPALLMAGAVLPLDMSDDAPGDENPTDLELVLLVGADGSRTLVEDDGTEALTDRIPTSGTALTWDDGRNALTIGAASAPGIVPGARTWTIRLLGWDEVSETHTDSGLPVALHRDGTAWIATVRDAPTTADLTLRFSGVRAETRQVDRDRLFRTIAAAQWDHDRKLGLWRALQTADNAADALASITSLSVPGQLASALTEILVTR